MQRINKIKRFWVSLFLCGTVFVFFQTVFADTEEDTVTVGASVSYTCGNSVIEGTEQCDDGNAVSGDGCSNLCATEVPGGGGGLPLVIPPPVVPPIEAEDDVTGPVIQDLEIIPVETSSALSWSAWDASGVNNCTIRYSVDPFNVDAFGVVNVIGGMYSTNIIGLFTGTKYFFDIRCTDILGNVGVYSNSFTTLGEADQIDPVISNVVVNTRSRDARITWKATDNRVVVQCSFVYDNDDANEPFVGWRDVNKLANNQYEVLLVNLAPNRQLFYKLTCVDANANSDVYIDTFTTLLDDVPPPAVQSFTANGGQGAILLSWIYNIQLPDFQRVLIRRGQVRPNLPTDGEEILSRNTYIQGNNIYVDRNVIPGVQYFYTIFIQDTSGNYSGGLSTSATALVAPIVVEICDNAQDDDADGFVDCNDLDCFGDVACPGQLPPPVVQPPVVPPDGQLPPPDVQQLPGAGAGGGGVLVEVCNNAQDDDADGFVDADDPDCFAQVFPVADMVKLSDFRFLLSTRTISAGLDRQNKITTLVQSPVTVGIDKNVFTKEVESLFLKIGQNSYQFNLEKNATYYVDFFSGSADWFNAILQIKYADNTSQQLNFQVQVKGYSQALDKNSGNPISGAEVTLFSGDNLFDTGKYLQQNPQTTEANGLFGFVLPNNSYSVRVVKEGYREYRSFSYKIIDNVFSLNIHLVKKAPPLMEGVEENDSLLQKTTKIAGNILLNVGENVQATSEKVKEAFALADHVANDPDVEKVTEQYIAPSFAALTIATIMPSLWSILLPLLRFLFLQPLLLLGKKKREGWGMVYNSVTKLPIDLAIVRLVDKTTHKVIQSRVTDGNGRFLFMARPGDYRIEVQKEGLIYPSKALSGVNTDGKLLDLYHGEDISVTDEQATLTPNIPLDPIGETVTITRIKKEKYIRYLQSVISALGIVVTAVSIYISPTWYMWVFLGVHIALYVGFKVFVLPKKPKGWGIVYDEKTKEPIGSTIVRLFTGDFNRLVSTQMTDRKGRYAFLAGPNSYYMTYTKEGYVQRKSEVLDYTNTKQEGDLIKKDIPLAHA
ncbi:MAG: DUF4215 domain-containing protein [Candidatus Magasanikbacteria bacterium]